MTRRVQDYSRRRGVTRTGGVGKGIEREGLAVQYLQAVFWAVMVTSGIGYDIAPQTNLEVSRTYIYKHTYICKSIDHRSRAALVSSIDHRRRERWTRFEGARERRVFVSE